MDAHPISWIDFDDAASNQFRYDWCAGANDPHPRCTHHTDAPSAG